MLLVYRAEHAGWGKASSAIYDDMFDGKCQLEVLGDGQQFVAYHIHPDTKQPYEWLDDRGGIENLAATDRRSSARSRCMTPSACSSKWRRATAHSPLGRLRHAHPGEARNGLRRMTTTTWPGECGRHGAAGPMGAGALPLRTHSPGGYRISPSIWAVTPRKTWRSTREGDQDFGIYDTGDARGGKRTPLDVVMEWGITRASPSGDQRDGGGAVAL